MTQQQLDYLCINQQTSVGLRTARLVALANTGDFSLAALTANIMASHCLVKSIKDYDITSLQLSDAELFSAQEKLLILERSKQSSY